MLLSNLRVFVARARANSLARNSLLLMATTAVNSALGYAFWVVVARTYPTRAVGLGAALISATTLVAMLSNLGASSTLIQVLPTRQAGRDWSRTFNACMGTAASTAFLVGVIALLFLPSLSPGLVVVRDPRYQVVIVVGAVLWTSSMVLDSTFVAERVAGKMLARNATAASLKLALVLCLVALGVRSSLGIISAWAMSTAGALLFGAFVLLPSLQRGFRVQIRGVAQEARRLIPPFVGHYFINVGGTLPMYLLPLFVTTRLSATANAYFYTTWLLCSVFYTVSPAVAAALFAEGSHAGWSLHRQARLSALLIAALLSLPVAVLLLGGKLILGFFGPGYAQHSYVLLVLLVVSAVPDAVTNIYVSVLRVEHRLRGAAVLNIAMGMATLVLAWNLLPKLGVAGAGLAWLVAQTAGSIAVAIDARLMRDGAA